LSKNYDYIQLVGYKIIKGEVLIKRKLLGIFSAKGYDLTFEQWTVLNVLFVEPGLIQSEIAVKTYKDKTNITRILDVLAKKDYVVRENNGKDRRSSCVFLTEKGKEMFNELIPCVKVANEQFVSGISESEFEVFSRVMDQISRNAE